jgi:hypothetical protein
MSTTKDLALKVAESCRAIYDDNFPMNRQAVEEGIATQSEYTNSLFSFSILSYMAANDMSYVEAASALFPEIGEAAKDWSEEKVAEYEQGTIRNAFRILWK